MPHDEVGQGVGILADTARNLVLLALLAGGLYLGVKYLPGLVRGNPNGRRTARDVALLSDGFLVA